jgi:hypothetical protein
MPADQSEIVRSHHDVFISYAKEDKPVADAVCAKLESKNIRCWIAPRDVNPGTNFPEAIIDGIEGGRVMILIFSSHANRSPHVIRELTNAVNKGRIIIPFRIEDVLPSKSMEYLISVPHWLDAVTPPLEKHIDVLIQTIGCIIGTDTSPAECLAQAKAEVSGNVAPEGTEKGQSVCPKCLNPVKIAARFCESCGEPIAENVIVPNDFPQDKEKSPVSEPQSPEPPPPGPALSMEESTDTGTPRESGETQAHPMGVGRHSRNLVGAGIIVVCLILAILGYQAGLLTLPMQQLNLSPADTETPNHTGVSDAEYYRGTNAKVDTVTLTTAPTQTLAKDTELFVEASKDMSNAVVTIQFNGGPGMGLVKDNRVVLTRSDGTVTEGKLNFRERLSSIQLQGTRGTDRVQVIITLYSGETRGIVDKLLPYRQYH